MSVDIARQLRLLAPFSEDGGLMVRAADALDGSGLPAFVSLVGIPDGPVEVTVSAREALLLAGWVAPEQVDAVEDRSWMEGFNMAAKFDEATREDAA